MLNGQRYRGIRSFLLHKRNEPKKGARQSASSCVFIIEWGENFFRSTHETINTPAHPGTGMKHMGFSGRVEGVFLPC